LYTWGLWRRDDKKRSGLLGYTFIIAVSLLAGAVAAEIFLSYRSAPRAPLPFYNRLYPYVMFRPNESYRFETQETYEMSHHKSRAFVYTNEDGFRIPSPEYKLPKEKPAGQLRIAFLGGSLVQLASTFDVTLPGALKILLQRRYPGRDIEVINAGIQSCVSRQSIAQLVFTVVDYHPDIVIMYDGGNDIGLPLTYESRPNFPYNFQTMEEAWDLYRQERRQPLWRIALERSNLFRIVRARLDPNQRKLVPTADEPFAGTNAVPASLIISDSALRVNQISAYLSNWRKLVELAPSYHYKPVCILTPTPGLDSEFALTRMMTSFHLDQATAAKWIQAFQLLYDEADRQIGTLRADYPGAVFMNLTHALKPPEKYFWDLAHVYDEANATLAEQIYGGIQPLIEAGR
jgi:lysophospholipase L1-like esterase